MIKLVFANTNDLSAVKKQLLAIVEKNKKEKDTEKGLYDFK